MQSYAQYNYGSTRTQEADGFAHMYESIDEPVTRKDLQALLKEAQRQKEAYEKETQVFLSDERKKALHD